MHKTRLAVNRNRRRTTGLKVFVSIADAGTSSIGNLAINVVAAHTLALRAFGAYSVAVLLALLVTGASRALHADTLILRYTSNDGESKKNAAVHALCAVGTSTSLVSVVAIVGAVAGRLTGTLSTSTFSLAMTFALVLPFLTLQDFLRYFSYAMQQPNSALLNSASWTGFLVILPVPCLLFGLIHTTPSTLFAVWGLTAVPACLLSARALRLPITYTNPMGWYRSNRETYLRLFADFFLLQAIAEGAFLIIALIAGPTGVALLRKAQLPLAPLTVMTAKAQLVRSQ